MIITCKQRITLCPRVCSQFSNPLYKTMLIRHFFVMQFSNDCLCEPIMMEIFAEAGENESGVVRCLHLQKNAVQYGTNDAI